MIFLPLAFLLLSTAGGEYQTGRRPTPLDRLVKMHYSADRKGVWTCNTRSPSRFRPFTFDVPGLPMMSCASTPRFDANVFEEAGGLYFVLLGAGKRKLNTHVCRLCTKRWVEIDRSPDRQQQERQCRFETRVRLRKGKHPLRDGSKFARMEGMRCHRSFRKGCDKGYRWCDGFCCRVEALFYYSGQQKALTSSSKLLSENISVAGPPEQQLLQFVSKNMRTSAQIKARRGKKTT